MIRQIFAVLLELKWKILLVVAVLIAIRCIWLWQPERQVQLHQQHFLEAAQDRNWSKLSGLIDESFRTPTGHDKTWALQQSSTVLRQFIALQIHASDTTITMEGASGQVRTRLRVEGNGMELAEMAKNAVNQSNDPFEFTWKHASWKPWDWRLVSADHPLLHVSGEF